MTIKDILLKTWMVIAVALMTGCGQDHVMSVPGPDDLSGQGQVVIDLNIAVGEPALPDYMSRAFTAPEPPFEGPATDYEKIHTLRVIILHPDGTVEHNRMVMFNASGAVVNDNLRFTVTGDEQKTIYVFANEAIVDYDFDKITDGSVFPTDEVAEITITRRSGECVIDNSQDSEAHQYIPMSEVFTVDVPAYKKTSMDDNITMAYLFVTRSLIKFSFCIINEGPFVNIEGLEGDHILEGVTVTGLTDTGYYLPCETIYKPGKNDPSAAAQADRIITSYTIPENPGYSSLYFPLIPAGSDTPGLDLTERFETEFAIYKYLPESRLQTVDGTPTPYYLSLNFSETTDVEEKYRKPAALNLTDLPRNTHAKINIYLREHGVTAEVSLVPYKGIWLNPGFGIDN